MIMDSSVVAHEAFFWCLVVFSIGYYLGRNKENKTVNNYTLHGRTDLKITGDVAIREPEMVERLKDAIADHD